MQNNTLQLKIKQRLNKLSSFDYDNIESWQVAEAFNKAQVEFVRITLRGYNMRQEGDEASKFTMDDLEQLITPKSLLHTRQDLYVESRPLPADYLAFKRVDALGETDCCKDEPLKVTLQQVADVTSLLMDENSKPSFDWRETFCTLQGNRVRVYTGLDMEITKPLELLYYRFPRKVSFAGSVDLDTGAETTDVTCEFRDDIAEILTDMCAEILAADIESINRKVMLQQHAESKR